MVDRLLGEVMGMNLIGGEWRIKEANRGGFQVIKLLAPK